MQTHEQMCHAVTSLLAAHATNTYAKEVLAPYIASVSLEMNHLYEDLGFQSRSEMGKFMMKNFSTLAVQKPKEKLWKKFLYDKIGAVAPACATCNDHDSCFSCLLKEMSA